MTRFPHFMDRTRPDAARPAAEQSGTLNHGARIAEARRFVADAPSEQHADRFGLERLLSDRFGLNQHQAGLLLAERAATERIQARGLGTADAVTPIVDELLKYDDTPVDDVTYHDQHVVDDHGQFIGTVTDVLYDDAEPTWLVVNPGMLRSERYLPVNGSSLTDDGVVVTHYDKQRVMSAPKAADDHIVTRSQLDALELHYRRPTSR